MQSSSVGYWVPNYQMAIHNDNCVFSFEIPESLLSGSRFVTTVIIKKIAGEDVDGLSGGASAWRVNSYVREVFDTAACAPHSSAPRDVSEEHTVCEF